MTTYQSICRTCHNYCGVLVDVEDNKVLQVRGDKDDPLFHGYSCNKGRGHPVLYDHPERLRSALRRDGGSHVAVDTDQAIGEVAARLRRIIDEHGPRSVALYQGTTASVENSANFTMIDAFMRAIGSPMRYLTATIDQAGKGVAPALHGMWMAPGYGANKPDTFLIVGKNPLVSHQSYAANPGDFFKDLAARNGSLIVIDPRRTETARRATVHLQARPGCDSALLAAMIHVILKEGLHDQAFIDDNTTGVEELRRVVEPFTPEAVAAAADVPVEKLLQAARLYASAERGSAAAGTGPNMTGEATLVEYLLLCLMTLCGHWMRAGEQLQNPYTIFPAQAQLGIAQAMPPYPGYGYGEPARVRGLGQTAFGMPTATAAEEILMEGPGQIRALLSVGGNPLVAWPDQEKTAKAFAALELLVQTDVVMSATAKEADYVFPMRLPYEQPGTTFVPEFLSLLGVGYQLPYAQYTPALVDAPHGVLDHPTFIFKLAKAMGLQLEIFPGPGADLPGGSPVKLDMTGDCDLEAIFDVVHSGSRIPLDRVRETSGGALYPEPGLTVAPKQPDWPGRLDLANPDMMADLTGVSRHLGERSELPFRLISRRMSHIYNSPTPAMPANRPGHNPAFMNPDDLLAIGAQSGSVVRIRSLHGQIEAIAEVDANLRRGMVSISHAWGDHPDRGPDDALPGACTAALIDNADVYDRYTGQPRMSNVPVAVTSVTPPLPTS
jgi:anaerobic selenocysteine-containing dehydrogenase